MTLTSASESLAEELKHPEVPYQDKVVHYYYSHPCRLPGNNSAREDKCIATAIGR